MAAVAFAQLRHKLAEVIDAASTGVPVTITRADGRNVVVVSQEIWESVQETAHLLSTDANRKHLHDAAEDAEVIIRRRRAGP
jgi:antitoxin YefM